MHGARSFRTEKNMLTGLCFIFDPTPIKALRSRFCRVNLTPVALARDLS